MVWLNTQKVSQSYSLAFSEAKRLVPILSLFGLIYLICFTLAMLPMGDLQHRLPAAPGAAPALPPIPLGAMLLMTVGIYGAAIVDFISRISAIRACSLNMPMGFDYFINRIRNGFLPVLHVAWSVTWRYILLTFAVTIVLVLVLSALTHDAGDQMAMGKGLVVLLIILMPLAGIYLMPFYFLGYFRSFHPEIPHDEAIRRSIAQVRGHRAEVFFGMLVTFLPMISGMVIAFLLHQANPLFSFVLIPVNVALSLPFVLLLYLYYEEFEMAEGLHPNPAALPPQETA